MAFTQKGCRKMKREICAANARRISRYKMVSFFTERVTGVRKLREPQWKLCLKTEDDKLRMLRSCHSSDTGITFKFSMEKQNSLHNFSTCRRTLGS